MRKIVTMLVLCSSLFLYACAASNSRQATDLVGKLTPYTRFTMLDGDYVGVEEFKGKTTVVVFWALWCNKSRRTLAKLNNFAASHKEAVFLSVNIDKAEKLGDLKDRITYTHLDNFKHAFSGNEVYDEAYIAYCGHSLPHIVVINKEGTIVSAGNEDDAVYRAFGVDPESVPEAE